MSIKLKTLDEYGYEINFNGVTFDLSSENLYSLLIQLKKNPIWNKRVERIVNSDIKTDVGRGSCPFPFKCNDFFECEDTYCNADTLSNGFAYRMS